MAVTLIIIMILIMTWIESYLKISVTLPKEILPLVIFGVFWALLTDISKLVKD